MTTTATDELQPLSSIASTRIRGLRAEMRLNQTDLARQVGLSRTGLSDRESGVKAVNIDELPIFAASLHTTVEYLLGLTNDRSPRRLLPGEGSVLPFVGDRVRHEGLEPPTRWLSVGQGFGERGGQVIPLHPRHPVREQVEQPRPAVVIPLCPPRRDVVMTATGGIATYIVDWPVAS